MKYVSYPSEEMTPKRRRYLQDLADEYGVDEETVFMLADMLGPNEDRDGLINALEDYELFCF